MDLVDKLQLVSPLASSALNARQSAVDFKRQSNFAWDMWNATNAYNSPVQQRARLQSAGFNPALMYNQSGSTGSATLGATPKKDTHPMTVPTGLDMANLQLAKSQKNNTDADTSLKRNQALTEIQEANLKQIEAGVSTQKKNMLEAQNARIAEMLEADLQLKGSQIGLNISRGRMSEAQAAKTISDMFMNKVKTRVEAEKAAAQVMETIQRVEIQSAKLGYELDILGSLRDKEKAAVILEQLKALNQSKDYQGFGGHDAFMQMLWVVGQVGNELTDMDRGTIDWKWRNNQSIID